MYAQIVVLTYQSPEIKSYTYEIPKGLDVKVGQLVSVPFGSRNPLGIVLELRAQRLEVSGQKIRPINSIVLKSPILLPYQIELLKWLNFYYQAPMVNCAKAMLPDIPKNPSSVSPISIKQSTVNQTLVLVPSINQIPQTLALFPNAKNYALYHGEQKPWERFSAWQKIKSGTVDLVIGTRSAIFTPCPRLKKIVIYDEHEQGYKDERSPYYQTLTVAEKIQELTKCQLEIVDPTPKIATYFRHSGIATRDETKVRIQIVNMQDEKSAGNKSALSGILQDYIKAGVLKNKKILLFLNKKAQSGHLFCKSCKFSDFTKKKPNNCPNCQSEDILFFTNNINSLANLVSKITGLSPKQSGSVVELNGITIATSAVFYHLMKQKYDLVAHVSVDTLLNFTDYTSPEKLYVQITSLKKITRGLLLLQTYNPDDPTIKASADGNYKTFEKNQLYMRKMLKYPPFVLLVKLTAKGKNEEKIEQKAQKLYLNLKNSLPTTNYSLLTILGPFKPTFDTASAKYNIILKLGTLDYSLSSREKAVKLAETLLAKVPNEWKVEVEADDIN